MQAGVGIDHADGGHLGQVQALGHQLRADQHVRLPRAHLVEDEVGRVRCLHHVPVEPKHARVWKQCPDFLLDAFRADAETLDVAAAAGRAAAWQRLGAATVVALQPAQRRVVDKGYAAVQTLARLAAVATEHEGRQPTAIQKEDRLLTALE